MSDLKLIDELLCDLKQRDSMSWDYIEHHYSNLTRKAMRRLREAYKNGEMTTITLGLAEYFRRTSDKA